MKKIIEYKDYIIIMEVSIEEETGSIHPELEPTEEGKYEIIKLIVGIAKRDNVIEVLKDITLSKHNIFRYTSIESLKRNIIEVEVLYKEFIDLEIDNKNNLLKEETEINDKLRELGFYE